MHDGQPTNSELSGQQLRALRSMNEATARAFGSALSDLLRSIVHVKLASIEQASPDQISIRSDQIGCAALIDAEPLAGTLAVAIDRPLLFVLVDRMLGGGREPASVPSRPPTDIELRLIGRVVGLFLDVLGATWRSAVHLRPRVERMEGNWPAVQRELSDGTACHLSLAVVVGRTEGTLALCVPGTSLASLIEKMAAAGQISCVQTGPTAAGELEVTAELAETTVTRGELAELAEGDILVTEQPPGPPVTVRVDGVAKFQGRPGALGGRKAVQIESRIESPGDDSVPPPQ